MTPDEYRVKLAAGGTFEMKQKKYATVRFRYKESNGKPRTGLIGLIEDPALSAQLAASFPENYLVEQVSYLAIEDPTESAPRVPVYMQDNSGTDVVAAVDTVDGTLSTILAKISVLETANLISAFFPKFHGIPVPSPN